MKQATTLQFEIIVNKMRRPRRVCDAPLIMHVDSKRPFDHRLAMLMYDLSFVYLHAQS